MEIDPSEFYFGNAYDLKVQAIIPDKLTYYDPQDLTTHAVITGMTGSGKTGMGIILLEEAALKGIPAILIDPKGDLTNHLLHFPDFLPSDFAPWVDADAAKREGQSIEQAAEAAAASWKKGTENSGIDRERMERLSKAVDYAVYTPGSDSAIPVSILSSLKAPDINWEDNKEMLREAIGSTVTALLELVGFRNVDPVRSREHILLANIFEQAWSKDEDLDLETLIMQVQNPPFEKLGVFSISKFYPEKDRFELAMLLNNFIAAPSFESWLEGQPLDIQSILYAPDGRARHSVFYLAHLADAERMFFVTLLYSAIETWMRAQSGTSDLRALVYFDEIVGYLPPVANPPSKPIILRMLKMARAFGVGLVLSTQNPIDLDYKALSNAGTWIIGKLQTDQDKQRLLDGLTNVAGTFDRPYFDNTISSLGKRVFLMHNVHAKRPEIFTTRWAMNYLPGPITRNKLDDLNRLVSADVRMVAAAMDGSSQAINAEAVVGSKNANLPGRQTEPVLGSKVVVYYLPVKTSLGDAYKAAADRGIAPTTQPLYHYRPTLIGQGQIWFANRTYNVNTQQKVTVLLSELDRRGLVPWAEYQVDEMPVSEFDAQPLPGATFADLSYPFDDEKNVSSLSSDFADWLYRNYQLTLYRNPDLKLVSEVGESKEDFAARIHQAGTTNLDSEIDKIKEKYAKQSKTIQNRLEKEEMALEKDKQTLNHRRLEEAGSGLQTVIGLFGGKKRSINTSLTKRRMTATAKANVEESEALIEKYKSDLAELNAKMQQDIEEYKRNAEGKSAGIEEVFVKPLKKDVAVEYFGLAWAPVYAFKDGDRWVEIDAF
ncbi:MAG: type IV secretion system DNA-binding domain-containing protein [Chloroflexi bacterium]|nr:type IV secretion system DNA-binding domain-containing protein [Chloroflexota bacterium]